MAPGLEHHHLFIRHHLGEFAEGGVETLDMAHLQQPGGAFCRPDQVGGLLLASGDRLFNQHMHARLQAGHADPVVQQGRHGNANRFHLLQQVGVGRKPAATELLNGQLAALRIGIGHTDQFGIPQQAQHPGVVPAHVADTDDANADGLHGAGVGVEDHGSRRNNGSAP